MTQQTLSRTTLTDPSPTQIDRLARIGLGVAAFGTVLAPIHALARYATEDGKNDLELPGPSLWAEPARNALEPILDWASADTVYVTYGKLFLFVMAFVTLAAFAVHSRRGETRGAEKWGWRLALTGYVILTAATFGEYWSPWLEESFAILGIPGMLIHMIGSTTLGIGLLRRGFHSRTTGVLLVLTVPLTIILSNLIALGAPLVALCWAWALAVRSESSVAAAR